MKSIHLLSIIFLSLILVGLATLNQVMVAMALLFVVYLAYGFFTLPTQMELEFTREISDLRIPPGTPVEIKLTVVNNGGKLDYLQVDDLLPPGLLCIKGSPSVLINLPAGEKYSWKFTVTGKRGNYAFDSIRVEIRDRLGIISSRKVYPTTGKLLVMPHFHKLKSVRIRPRKTRVYSGEISARNGGLGVDFYGVRQYQQGDAPAWINWRVSAKYPDSLFSNEYEQERVADVGIILDGRERSNKITAKRSIFEYSVMAAASLASRFLEQGDRVSLLHYGKYLQWTFPGYGKVQRERILRALMDVEPGKSLVFEYLQYLPTQIFPAQSQIVLISPLTDDDPDVLQQIRAKGYQVLVISPNPIAFERKLLPDSIENQMAFRILTMERTLFLKKLQKGGIQVVNWDVSQPFDGLIRNLAHRPTLVHSMEINS